MVLSTSLDLKTMNEVIKKAAEELAKDSPNIPYVRGMLETLLSMNTVSLTPTTIPTPTLATIYIPPPIEGVPPLPDVEKIKKLAEESQ